MDQPGERRSAGLSLLLTSPRVAPGLLAAQGWEALRAADHVVVGDPTTPQARALAARGVGLTPLVDLLDGPATPQTTARALLDLTARGSVLWVGSADGDPGLAEAIAVELPDEAPTLEVVVGSWDTPGARLLDAVAVMDRLRSPGGCPWDAQQTHASLVPYLIEEAHEAVEALEQLDGPDAADSPQAREHALEELGDVLLQVLFHARVASDHPQDPFDVDDVAAGLVAKLVRRHPHVFADAAADTPEAVEAGWEAIKARENAGKPERSHPLDGIPSGMPSLARAGKVASRLGRAGHGAWLAEQVAARSEAGDPGAALLALVLELREAGTDADSALRHTLREIDAQARHLH